MRPLRTQCWIRDSNPWHLGRSIRGLYVRIFTPSTKALVCFTTEGLTFLHSVPSSVLVPIICTISHYMNTYHNRITSKLHVNLPPHHRV